MNNNFTRAVLPWLAAALLLTGCKKDDPTSPGPDPNPQELITTIILQLTDTTGNTANAVTAAFRDLDGPGGNPPTVDTVRLKGGVGYDCRVVILDETKTPVDTVSNEVAEEGTAHRIWYSTAGGIAGRVAIVPIDNDGGTPTPLPIGLLIRVNVSTAGAAAGTLRSVLKHYQPESTKRSDTNGSLGETDFDVTFPISIAP